MRLSLAGVAAGLALTYLLTRVMVIGGALGPTGLPPGTALLVAALTITVAGVACLASWIPARRAAQIDPLSALRIE